MYPSMFNYADSIFGALDQLQWPEWRPNANIRQATPGTFPAINVGSTSKSVEVYMFVPGVNPQKDLEVQIDKNLLSIKGERKVDLDTVNQDSTVHAQELFSGQFRRVLSLPDDVDNSSAAASYKDGVLHISIQRQTAAQPKSITVE